MNPLALVPLRFWIYGAVAAAIGFLLWRDHHQTTKLNVRTAEVRELTATLKLEREHRRRSDEASNRYQARIQELEAQRTADGFGAVRLCRRPVIRVSPAAGGPDVPAVPDELEPAWRDIEVGRDIGPELERFGYECEANAIRLDELQRFIRGESPR